MAEVHPAINKMKTKFPASVLDVTSFRGEVNVTVPKKDIFEICRFLYTDSDLQYNMLTDLCGEIDRSQRYPSSARSH